MRTHATSLIVLAIMIAGWCASRPARAQEHAALSEVQKLKGENYKLRRQLVTGQCQQAIQQLEADRTLLEADYRATLAAPDHAMFDWNAMAFAPARKDPQ